MSCFLGRSERETGPSPEKSSCPLPNRTAHTLSLWKERGTVQMTRSVQVMLPRGEVNGTRSPPMKKTGKDNTYQHYKEMAVKQHHNSKKIRMYSTLDDPKTLLPKQALFPQCPLIPGQAGSSHHERYREKEKERETGMVFDADACPCGESQCQQELDKVLENISQITFHDNKGPLENLYDLKFPNCDKTGQYNLKQCHMSNHGQRGECWCVNPFTGVQISSSPKVRGDPNCSQYYGGPELEPPTAQQK
ncbi:Insulin-like growth factor-binding protein 2-B [Anabarilius grahami]|uniref:Insulin-like growth factor-binding protein 2-B n=1 Tax=Anabarilius grahami TaxID=495550 RepID=A0A3N0Z1Y0_ANAGA|nr:Insulin-like growth factor-binding protein 2-B [Anabarilius grahami]